MPAARLLTATLGCLLALAPATPALASTIYGGEASGSSIGVWVSSGGSSSGRGGSSHREPAVTCHYVTKPGAPDAITWTFEGTTYYLNFRICTDGTATPVWIPQLSARDLAGLARDDVRRQLPNPSIGLAPAAERGVVHLGTWVWTTTPWRPVTATATIPGLAATVTATPTRLRFDPGDGSKGTGPLTCTGPGQPWQPVDGDDTPSACMYTYGHASSLHPTGRWPATLSIDWAVSYAATDGTSGGLGTITTATAQPVTVGEIQALVTAGS